MRIILRINKIIKVIYLIYVFFYLHIYHIYNYSYIINYNWCSKIIIKTLTILITNLFYECDDDDNNYNSMYTI